MDQPFDFERLKSDMKEWRREQITKQLSDIQHYVEEQCADKSDLLDKPGKFKIDGGTQQTSDGLDVGSMIINRKKDNSTSYVLMWCGRTLIIENNGRLYMSINLADLHNAEPRYFEDEKITLDDLVNNDIYANVVQSMAEAVEDITAPPAGTAPSQQ